MIHMLKCCFFVDCWFLTAVSREQTAGVFNVDLYSISPFSSTKFPVNALLLLAHGSVSRAGCLRRGDPHLISQLKNLTVGIQRQKHPALPAGL